MALAEKETRGLIATPSSLREIGNCDEKVRMAATAMGFTGLLWSGVGKLLAKSSGLVAITDFPTRTVEIKTKVLVAETDAFTEAETAENAKGIHVAVRTTETIKLQTVGPAGYASARQTTVLSIYAPHAEAIGKGHASRAVG